MMFGLWTRVGHRNHVLGGGPDPPKGRGNFGASPSQLCSKGIPSTSQSYSPYGSSNVAFHCQNCSNLLFLCSRSIVLVCWTKIHSHCSQLSATMSNLFPKHTNGANLFTSFCEIRMTNSKHAGISCYRETASWRTILSCGVVLFTDEMSWKN